MLAAITLLFVITCIYIFYGKWKSSCKADRRHTIKDSYINVMCVFFGAMAALRNIAVGPDTYAYYLKFLSAESQSFQAIWDALIVYYRDGVGKDAGFPLLMKLFQCVFPSFRLFLIFNAIVFYSGVAYIIKCNTRTLVQAFLSIILFITLFQVYAFSAVRQDFALGCVMLSYRFIKERRLLPFLILILIASTLHKSVLIFIPYYWIANITRVKILAVISVVLIPTLFIAARSLTSILVDVSGSEQYALYLGQNKEAGTPTFTALLIGCFIMYLCMINNLNKAFPKHHFFTNTIFLTVGLCHVTWVVPDFMRILLYFSCFLPVIMADCISLVPDKAIRKYIVAGYVAAVGFLFIKTIPPYEFFWSQMDLGSNYIINVSTIGI